MSWYILPDGFLLKKCIVALMIDPNIRLCRFVEDVVHTDTNKADLINVNIIIDTVIIVNTIIHV